jgi:hypothetical protein
MEDMIHNTHIVRSDHRTTTVEIPTLIDPTMLDIVVEIA